MTESAYDRQINAQIAQFAEKQSLNCSTTTADWLVNTYVAPRLSEVFGVSHQIEIFLKHFLEATARSGVPTVVSLGAGDGALELQIMKWARDAGVLSFRMRCFELSPVLVKRIREGIEAAGLSEWMTAEQKDLNVSFMSDDPVAAVMIHHAAHHFVALEHIFAEIDAMLHPEGAFLVMDMIGRNGHMRWPETLGLVRELWDGLPDRYKWSHQHGRLYRYYENWDCSIEGFEGIRAQDILPLLLKRFRFEKFYANLALSDVFMGPSFGPNFDISSPQDRAFIEAVQTLEDNLLDRGLIKPTQMYAVMRTLRSATCPSSPTVYRTRTPEQSLRCPEVKPDASALKLGTLAFSNPYRDEAKRPALVCVEAGHEVGFGKTGFGQHLTRWGWNEPEDDFSWCWGIDAGLEFQAGDTFTTLRIRGLPCQIPGNPERRFEVWINDELSGRLELNGGDFLNQTLSLPGSVMRGDHVWIRLTDTRPRRPDLDGGLDTRPLGFALYSLEFA